MIPKPKECKGCILYDDGQGFVPDELVNGAQVTILAQNPGKEEEKESRPMVGKTGQDMNKNYLPIAGLERGHNVNIRNVLKCRWRKDGKKVDELPPEPILSQAVEHCTKNYLTDLPDDDNHLIVAMGDLSFKYLVKDNDMKLSKWRGFLVRTDRNPS